MAEDDQLCKPTTKHWFQDTFENICTKWMGLRLSTETLKQIAGHEGDTDFLYRLAHICRDEPDQDLAVRSHLDHPALAIPSLKEFLAAARQHGAAGARRKSLLGEFASGVDLGALQFHVAGHDAVVAKVVARHVDKIRTGDPEKIVNWLVGQVMASIPDRRSADIAAIKTQVAVAVRAHEEAAA